MKRGSTGRRDSFAGFLNGWIDVFRHFASLCALIWLKEWIVVSRLTEASRFNGGAVTSMFFGRTFATRTFGFGGFPSGWIVPDRIFLLPLLCILLVIRSRIWTINLWQKQSVLGVFKQKILDAFELYLHHVWQRIFYCFDWYSFSVDHSSFNRGMTHRSTTMKR